MALLDTIDPQGREAVSGAFADRARGHMSAAPREVMRDIREGLWRDAPPPAAAP